MCIRDRVILNTADSLATLFNPRVGTILSWPRNVEMFGGHTTIMDNLINLEMLFWAAKNGGNPYLACLLYTSNRAFTISLCAHVRIYRK